MQRNLILGSAWTALVLILLIASAFPGCGSQTTGTGPTAGTGQSGSVQVLMKNTTFIPADVTVKVGQTVTWANEDPIEHDVVANDGSFQSSVLPQGGTFSFTFTKSGSFPYYCAIHPSMTGAVTVEP
jgi:plastocyanin